MAPANGIASPDTIAARLVTLATMLRSCRPAGSLAEQRFRREYLENLPDVSEDRAGNLIGAIPMPDGTPSRVAWSSHTDTCHYSSGEQTLAIDGRWIGLSAASTSSCLGADDTTGVWIMREMYRASVPGLYLWHYGEEIGCQGSAALADDTPEILDGIDYAIAFDRAGTRDIVTTQRGEASASKPFANRLAGLLRKAGAGRYAPARGVYTDTAEYTHIVAECSNLSVGYERQHTPSERQDYLHADRLLRAILAIDQTRLLAVRTPVARPRYVPMFASAYRHSWRDYGQPIDVAGEATCFLCGEDEASNPSVRYRYMADEYLCDDCADDLAVAERAQDDRHAYGTDRPLNITPADWRDMTDDDKRTIARLIRS